MPKCPICGKNTETILNEWDYSVFQVKNFKCPFCPYSFNAYYKQGLFSHAISNTGCTIERRLTSYLKKGSRTLDEIASALNIPATEAEKLLEELEKKAIVDRVAFERR